MPGIGDSSQPSVSTLGQPLVTPATPLIAPSSIPQMVQAIREGTLTAHDILDRVGELGQAKKKAELMNVGEYTSQLGQTARETALQSAIWKAQATPGDYEAKLKALAAAGEVVPVDLKGGFTDEQKRTVDEKFADVSNYMFQRAAAQDWLKNSKVEDKSVKEIDSMGNEKTTVFPGAIKRDPTGNVVDDQTYSNVRNFSITPYQIWKAHGKRSIFDIAPGASAIAPSAQAGRASEVPVEHPQAPIEPRALSPAPAERPMISPGGGMVTETKQALSDSPEKVLKSVQEKDNYKRWDKSLDTAENLKTIADEIRAIPPEEQGRNKNVMNEKDIALVETAIKLYDPEGVIRSFKWDKTAETRPLNELVSNLAPILLKKESLTPPQRERLLNMSFDLVRSREKSVIPDLRRVESVEKAWGRPVLNDRERSILGGTSMAPSSTTATAGPSWIGPSGAKSVFDPATRTWRAVMPGLPTRASQLLPQGAVGTLEERAGQLQGYTPGNPVVPASELIRPKSYDQPLFNIK